MTANTKRKTVTGRTSGILCLALLGGCASGEIPGIEGGPVERTQNVAPTPTMAPDEVPLVIEMDTVTAAFDFAVRGVEGEAVRGTLADAAGRRALAWIHADGREEVLAKAGWHLPPVAAVDASGARAVCYNRLAEGIRPSAGGGVALHCRLDAGDGFGPEIRVASKVESAWLQDLTATDDGFRVRYHQAPAGRLMPAPGEDSTRVVALTFAK